MIDPNRAAWAACVVLLGAALAWAPGWLAWAAARSSVVVSPASATIGAGAHDGEPHDAAPEGPDDRALESPLDAPLPYRETLRVDAGRPETVVYRLDVRRGERLTVEVEGAAATGVALDLFELSAEGHHTRVHDGAVGGRELAYEVRGDLPLLLRARLASGTDGESTITILRGPSLAFPVAGKDSRSIGSVFGVPRAGGKRTHHGVDIFAPRGTLVVAGLDGEAWVGTNKLGGNIIFIADRERDILLYYAHLDVQLIASGARVNRGDPIGRIGNTGNAKTTAPHLHFGIYSRGPIDPDPFIHAPKAAPPRATARQRGYLGARMRVSGARARLLGGPGARAERRQDLAQGTVFAVRGVHRDFLRVQLPDGTTGWLAARAGRALTRPIKRLKLSEETVVRGGVEPSAPMLGRVPGGEWVELLGGFGPARYVRTAAGLEGWIDGAISPGR